MERVRRGDRRCQCDALSGSCFRRPLRLFRASSGGPFNQVKCVILRLDTQASFAQADSWSVFDTSPLNSSASFDAWQFTGGAFDGRYVYFIPGLSYAPLLRFDTQASFGTTGFSSLVLTKVANTAGAGPFEGAEFDGEYLYLVPNGSYVLRFDARAKAAMPSAIRGGSFF